MAAALGAYVDSVAGAVAAEDGQALAGLLSPAAPGPRAAAREAAQASVPLGQMCSRLPPPFDELAATHCQSLAALEAGRPEEAYGLLVSSVGHLLKAFRDSESAWLVAPLKAAASGLRLVAEEADREARGAGRKAEKLNDAGSQLMKLFSASLQAGGAPGKRLGTLFIVTLLFKVYFKLNTLGLCKNLVRAVESPVFPPFDDFPKAHAVTYQYYAGRLSVFNDDYARAEGQLEYALARCARSAPRNVALVLQYLVPVKLVLGKLPAAALLQRHGLEQYAPVAAAVRRGDVRLLNSALEEHQERFIRDGTYLILEKLRAAVYRRLLKRIHLIQQQREPAKAFQLHLGLLQRALRWMGEDMDLDEVECVLANLVYRRYVKGYISHKSRVIVLSKQQAFPPLGTVLLHDPA